MACGPPSYPVADDGVRSFVDLNTIPIGTVDRVEVLKDGASAQLRLGCRGRGGQHHHEADLPGRGGRRLLWRQRSTAAATRCAPTPSSPATGDLGLQGWNAYVDLEYQNDGKIAAGQRDFPYNTTDLSSIGGNNLIGGQPGLNSAARPTARWRRCSQLASGPYPSTSTAEVAAGAATTTTNPATPTDPGGTYCAQNFVALRRRSAGSAALGRLRPLHQAAGLPTTKPSSTSTTMKTRSIRVQLRRSRYRPAFRSTPTPSPCR